MSKTPEGKFNTEEENIPALVLSPHTPSLELSGNSELFLNTPSQK